jgi:general secretion pathway protein D
VEEVPAQPLVVSSKAGDDEAAKSGAVEPRARLGLVEPEYFSGSGILVRTPAAGEAGPGEDEQGRISLNFADADVRDVVDAVLGDTLGLNYIIDPQVQGTVVARTSEPIERADVIPALESILALNGAALRLSGGVYHVEPLQMAARGLPQARSALAPGQRARGFSVTVIPLRFASAEAVHRVVAGFVPPERVFEVDPTRNLLIFAGTGTEADDLAGLVRLFDVDWMTGMSFALFPIEVADVTELVGELDQVFGQGGEGPLVGVVRFLPIKRMNAILAISPQQAYLKRAGIWIERLDRGEGSAQRRVYVYYVQNSRAEELAAVLGQIFDLSPASASAGPEVELAPGLSQATLSSPPTQPATGEAPAEGEAPAAYASGQEQGVRSRDAGLGVLIAESGDVRIIPDERNNALVILATPSEYRMIEATLERLDIVPLQVMIEATIAEVTLDDELSYGLQWFFHQGDVSGTFSTLSSGAVSSSFPGFSFLFSQVDAQVVLNALTDVTDVKVISSPQLMVLDNQSASLQVGDEVPIITQSQTSAETTTVVNSVQYRETGVLLEITPRVNASGLVVLEIVQEVSDAVATETSDIDSPTITQRRVESTVAVQSGETVALAGLIRDNRTDGITGIPVLANIPILGNLFKTTSEDVLRTELLVLITPRVISGVADARAVTEELRARMRSLEPLERRVFGGGLSPASGEPAAQP